MANTESVIIIGDLTGGRNGYDPPLSVPNDQAVEALNVDCWDSTVGTKRLGAAAIGVTFSAGGPFAGSVGSLIRHVPGDDETAAELWAIDGNAVNRFARLTGGTTWVDVTLKDNLATNTAANNVIGASLNGFLFLCYKASGVNRGHVYDPLLNKVRQTGIGTPNVPTGADDAAGALSLTRSYRTRDLDISGSDVRRISEPSAVLTRTIAAKAGSTITKGAATNEDETHWDLEAADTPAGPWYRIARTVIGTTTFDDTSATIDTTNLSAAVGINYPPPSAKFVIATDARLLYANGYETSGGYVTPKNSRVWITPVIGDTDIGDLERIPSGHYLDVDAAVTGLGGPLQGSVYVFSYRKTWKLVPTGDSEAPYAKYAVSPSIGCIRHQSIVSAEDEQGNPCLYFLSHRGPYRIGPNGLQYLGADIVDLWATVNLGGTSHAVYHADKHQIWWFLSTSANPYSGIKVVFDTRKGHVAEDGMVRRGWFKHTGTSCVAYASVMFSTTIGASMSRDLKPYVAQGTGAVGAIWRCDETGVYADAGTTYQAYVETKEYAPVGIHRNLLIKEPHIIASTDKTDQTIRIVGFSDFHARDDAPGSITLSATDGRVHKKVEGVQLSGIGSFSLRLGDTAATADTWSIDACVVPYAGQELR